MLSVRLICASAALSLLWGCTDKSQEKAKEHALESATGGNAEIGWTDSSETVTLDDGEEQMTIATGETLTAPANYPTGGFIPDDAEVKTSVSQGESMMIVYVIPGPLPDAVSRSRRVLRDRGWTEDDVVESNGGLGFVSYRKEKSILSEQFLAQADGHVEVTQMYVSGN